MPVLKCTKAIIPVAGYGTRRLPITKTIEKSMLPIGDRPIIDYVVEDCIKAGITDIYIVVGEGSTQVAEYYAHNTKLEDYLTRAGKEAMLPLIQPPDVRIHFVEQSLQPGAPHGTSVPVLLCREFIEPDEAVVVLMGDDFIFNADGSSEVSRLLALAEQTGGSALLAAEVPRERVSQYGIIAAHQTDQGLQFDHIQEKPSIEEAQSNLINISKYVFAPGFFDYLKLTKLTKGEYYITDVINEYVAANNPLYVLPAQGEYLDGGSVESWLYANTVVIGAAKQGDK